MPLLRCLGGWHIPIIIFHAGPLLHWSLGDSKAGEPLDNFLKPPPKFSLPHPAPRLAMDPQSASYHLPLSIDPFGLSASGTGAAWPAVYLDDGQNLFDDALSFSGVSWRAGEAASALIESGTVRASLGEWTTEGHSSHVYTYASLSRCPSPPSGGSSSPPSSSWASTTPACSARTTTSPTRPARG